MVKEILRNRVNEANEDVYKMKKSRKIYKGRCERGGGLLMTIVGFEGG